MTVVQCGGGGGEGGGGGGGGGQILQDALLSLPRPSTFLQYNGN